MSETKKFDGLEVRNVTVRYGVPVRRRRRSNRAAADSSTAAPAVRDVSFTVARGEVVALTGPSGSGKSTLLRAIAGLEPLEEGSVLWAGHDLARVPPHQRGIVLMFQDGQLFAHMNVAANVGYGLIRTPRAEREHRVSELLRLVGLPDYGQRAVTELSGGERQRVALARSLAPRPHMLMLDEPLSALDRGLRDRLATDLARLLRETKTTAIMVTHDLHEAEKIADRTLRLHDGELAA